MENYKEAAFNYLTRMGYFSNRSVFGIVLDVVSESKQVIKICVVMDDRFNNIVSDFDYQDGFDIEYTKISIKYIEELIGSSQFEYNNLIKLITKGFILYDRTNRVRKIQKYALEKCNQFDNEVIRIGFFIKNEIDKLKMMSNIPLFNYNYYLLIEQIKILYIKGHGYDDISTLEAFKIYSGQYNSDLVLDNDYFDFIKMYVDLIICESDINYKIDLIEQFYLKFIKDSCLDGNKLLVKEKCDVV